MPVEEGNGVGLYYELHGERGDPMVLIHGAWFDHHCWDPVVPELSSSFRVLTYDRRGHGKSQSAVSQGGMEEDALDASSLLNRLGLPPAHVVGQSTGAIVALRLVIRHPQVVRTLSVHEPPLFGVLAGDPAFAATLVEGARRREAVMKVLEAGDWEGGARLFVETQMTGPGGWDKLPDPVRETFVANARNYLDEMRNGSDATIDLNALGQFRGPALLSYGGTSGPLMRPVIEKLAKAMPPSRIHTYAGAGHNVQLTHPREFTSTITAFASFSERGTHADGSGNPRTETLRQGF